MCVFTECECFPMCTLSHVRVYLTRARLFFHPSPKAEPRQYAGLALLKLADNFENHVAIAKAGGLTALLQLGRGGAVDEEYKCVGG